MTSEVIDGWRLRPQSRRHRLVRKASANCDDVVMIGFTEIAERDIGM
jgi:hypothetical protein